MFFKKTLAAAAVLVASFGFSNTSNAQDDWTGAYFGGFGAVSFPGTYFTAGTIAGYDVQFGNIVMGVNFRGSWNFIGPPSINIEGGARIGFVLANNILAYGNAAIGMIGPVPGSPYYSFGGGIELGITDTLHLFAEVRRSIIFCCGPNLSVHVGMTLHN
jgi:hypothetical protein